MASAEHVPGVPTEPSTGGGPIPAVATANIDHTSDRTTFETIRRPHPRHRPRRQNLATAENSDVMIFVMAFTAMVRR